LDIPFENWTSSLRIYSSGGRRPQRCRRGPQRWRCPAPPGCCVGLGRPALSPTDTCCLQSTKCRGIRFGGGRVQTVRCSFILRPEIQRRPRPCSACGHRCGRRTRSLSIPRSLERTMWWAPRSHRFVSVLGAAWLLMGQANISETSTFTDTSPPPRRRDPASTTSSTPQERQPVTVTLVDLRGARAAGKRSRRSDRRSQEERTWVAWPGGYWRQQAFGPGHSLRKPKWVGPYTKGPEGAPLAAPKPRVNVLRG
jgi:hypothetical protein